MASPRFLRSNYGDLFGPAMLPVLEELFRSQLLQHPSRREQLFKIVSTDRDIWQASELHDMPLLQQMSEGQDYTFEAPPQGAHKTLIPKKFGLGFSISEEAIEDGKFAFAADAVAKLAKSAKESQEIYAMNTYNNGFSTVTSIDGASLFSASHALPSGSTWRNKLSSDSDLSVASLKQMLIDFQTQQVGDSGIIYNVQPRYLVVRPENEFLAREIVGSSLLPDTAVNGSNGITNVNNMNSLQNSLQVISSPHLTDADAWFVQAAPEETGLRIIQRKPIETKAAGPDVGFKNDAMYYKCRYREEVGATQALGVFGTPGAP